MSGKHSLLDCRMATRLNTTCVVDNLWACVCFFLSCPTLMDIARRSKRWQRSVHTILLVCSAYCRFKSPSSFYENNSHPCQCDPKYGFHQELGSTAPAGMQTFSASGNEVYFACLLLDSENRFSGHHQNYHPCPKSPALQLLSEPSLRQLRR